MNKIGIIGGLAWPSTVDYYRLICTKTNEYFRVRGACSSKPESTSENTVQQRSITQKLSEPQIERK
jgi:aspartate/glutamate racemase